ncbi:MAG: hypothetical protein HUJ63_11490, partial [Enterococcus sp.]|nr:hypothetical protein [Enterococcus sp.]
LISAILCYFCKLNDTDIEQGLKSFQPLEHRIEPVGQIDGITFINDSKATNVEASCKALTAFPKAKIIALFGGKDKGTKLDLLIEKSFETCKYIICFGQAGDRFYSEFSKYKDLTNNDNNDNIAEIQASVYKEKNLNSAFNKATALAIEGDYVLLSPACASFDEFNSFEQRGQYFKELVGSLK